VDALRRDEREAVREVEPQLAAEDAPCAGSGAVGFMRAVRQNVAQEVLVRGGVVVVVGN